MANFLSFASTCWPVLWEGAGIGTTLGCWLTVISTFTRYTRLPGLTGGRHIFNISRLIEPWSRGTNSRLAGWHKYVCLMIEWHSEHWLLSKLIKIWQEYPKHSPMLYDTKSNQYAHPLSRSGLTTYGRLAFWLFKKAWQRARFSFSWLTTRYSVFPSSDWDFKYRSFWK